MLKGKQLQRLIKQDELVLINENLYALKNEVGQTTRYLYHGQDLSKVEGNYRFLSQWYLAPEVLHYLQGTTEYLIIDQWGESMIPTTTDQSYLKLLAEALWALHHLDLSGYLNGEHSVNEHFIHGAPTLEAFRFEENQFIGFLELDNSQIGDINYDIAFLVNSLYHHYQQNFLNQIVEFYGTGLKLEIVMQYLRQMGATYVD